MQGTNWQGSRIEKNRKIRRDVGFMASLNNRTTLGRVVVTVIAGALSGTLAGCNSTSTGSGESASHINTTTKFSVAEYGVPASPRVTTARSVKKGGGRDHIGKPYKVRGKWYVPKEEPGYDKAGLASWYGPNFHGRLTANGEVYDQFHLSAAHPTFPLPSYARVTNKKNGKSVVVRVNDRGPFAHGRIIDVSSKAAELLQMKRDGVAAVRVEYVGRAPLEGNDMPFLMASYNGGGNSVPTSNGAGDYGASGVMLAMNGPQPSTSLPGVGSAVNGGLALQAQPAVMTASAGAAMAASMPPATVPVFEAVVLPASFTLPEAGPVPGDRPFMPGPMANAVPEGFSDIGMAYRGDRPKSGDTSPFAALLGNRIAGNR